MPELSDVEGFRRVLDRHANGRLIDAVEVPDRTLLRNTTPQALGRAVRGRRFGDPARHGKWLIAPVDGSAVLMHFGMTGALDWMPRGWERHPHDRIVFLCDDGELRYRNMRKFGGVWVARSDSDRERITGPLGPDAAGLPREDFHALLEGRRGSVKAALMDQRLLAGLGNLLVDEILWRAGVDPRTPVPRLRRPRRDALYDGMREVLRGSIPAGRVPHGRSWLTSVRDVKGAACPRCGTPLRRARVAGRTACWCPRCQRRRS
jgi:formamidopyrimidine-DNA glycosylase